jgi:Cysteine rich repeat
MQIGHSGVASLSVLAAMLCGAWLVPALAQQPSSEQIAAIRQSCRSDFMSHCAGVQPGGKDALQCLKRNAGSVSAACKSALDAVGAKPAAGGAEPAPPPPAPAANRPEPADAAPAPPPEPAAEPGPPSAPMPNESAGPGSPQVGAVRAACRSDFGVHCPGVRPGGAAALRCLQVNAAALSPRCRRAVEAMGEGGAPPPGAAAPEAPEAPAAAPPAAVAPLGPIPPMRPRQALEILSFCGPERAALCGDVPPGGGRIIVCLAENAPRLSPGCYGAIARAIR